MVVRIVALFFLMVFTNFGLQAQEKSKLEKWVDKAYGLTEGKQNKPKKSYFFLIPFGANAPETSWSFGISTGYIFRVIHDSITRPSLIRFNTQYTLKNQLSIRPTIDMFFAQNKYNVKGQFIYNRFNEYYWGIGNNKLDNNRKQLYDFKLNRVNAKVTRQFIKSLYIGAQLQYEKLYGINLNDTISPNGTNISGINGYSINGLGFAITYDNRDQIYYTLHGTYIDISNLSYQKIFGSNYTFNNITIDARKYWKLWKTNVLALQIFGNFNSGDVPYRQMGTMGNESYMRGYYNGRYRDKNLYTFQFELRKTIWGPLGMTIFGGGANVGANSKDLFSAFKPDVGFGFRCLAIRKEHLNLRMDFGFGNNGIKGMYITMGEAF